MAGEYIYGLNSVVECIKASRREIYSIYTSRSNIKDTILEMCSCEIKEVNKQIIERYIGNTNHQGIIARVSSYPYVSFDKILASINKDSIILIFDSVEDPRNLGGMLRSAWAFGVTGVLLPQRGGVHITPVVVKTSAGGTEWLKICIVKNLIKAIDTLKDAGLSVFGIELGGADIRNIGNRTGAVSIVMGGENKGISKKLIKRCDGIFGIPTSISLNVSIACGIAIYEIKRGGLNYEKAHAT